MRIGLFTDTYTPDINGVVTSIVTLKHALEKLGHTVFVITNHKDIINASYEDGILRLPGVEVKFLYGYVLSSPIHIQASSTIKEMELDVIHAHSEFGIGIFARAVSKNQQIPLVMTYHTTYEDYTHYVNLLGLRSIDMLSRRVVASVSRLYSKGSEIIIVPSEKTKLMLLRYKIKKRIDVIPTGLELERFREYDQELNDALKKKFKVGDVPLFVYIGRLAKEKSVDFVIEGFKKLIEQGTKAQLMIVGDGPSRDDLEDLAKSCGIAEHVIFAGSADSKEVVRFYQIADGFISASLTETQGLTYIEALACGLCVFARPDKPIENIILENETGYYFNTHQEFADKVKNYIESDESEKKRLHDNALNSAAQFDSKHFGKSVLNTYQDAIDSYFGTFVIDVIGYFEEDIFISVVSNRPQKAKSDNTISSFVIDEFLLEKHQLKKGDTLSRNEINNLEDEQQIYEAYKKMVIRISKRMYTSHEIKQYLRDHFDLNEESIQVVLNMLIERNFIDDERYLTDKLAYYRSLMYGNYRIEENFVSKGYDVQVVRDLIAQEPIEERIERARYRANQFVKSLHEGSIRQREKKLRQHLERQGFEPFVIDGVVMELVEGYSDETEYQDLLKALPKAFTKYSKKYEFYEAKNRTIRYCLSRGYGYDMIIQAFDDLGYTNSQE